MAREKRHRVVIDLREEIFEKWKDLAKLAGHHNIREMIRYAVQFYRWYITRKKEGYEIALIKDGKTIEVDLGFIP